MSVYLSVCLRTYVRTYDNRCIYIYISATVPAWLQWSVYNANMSVCQLLVGMFSFRGPEVRSLACLAWPAAFREPNTK